MANLTDNLLAPLLVPARRLHTTLRGYSLGTARADAVAGLTVAVVELPQAMAYAYIAGVPPQYGIYTSIIQGIIAALFSSSDHLASGPTNTQSLLVFATVAPLVASVDPGNGALYLQLTIGLTLLKGVIQLVFALARMGNLVRYVSQSVIVGFTAGAGILIAVGQIDNFLGVETRPQADPWPGVLGAVHNLVPVLDQVRPLTVLVGLLALAIVIGSRLLSRFVPGPLLAIVIPALLVAVLGWTDNRIALVPELPQGLPSPAIPWLSWREMEALLGGAFAIALLGMIETVSIGKSIATHTRDRISANQEFFAQGLANVVGSFFQTIPGSGSFTRSALSHMAGAATRLAGVFNSLFVAAFFLVLAPLASYVPMASLAAILFVVAWQLIDWRYILRLARTNVSDVAVCLITFASTLLMPLAYAIYIGIFLNIALYLRRASHLHIAEMVRTPDGPFVERPVRDRAGEQRVIFLQIEGDLFFALADELQDRLSSVASSGARVVILRLKRTHSLDATVLSALERFVQQMRRQDGYVLLCGLRPDLYRRLRAFGLVALIGEENVFPAESGVFTSAKRALQRARILVGSSLDVDQELTEATETEEWAYEI